MFHPFRYSSQTVLKNRATDILTGTIGDDPIAQQLPERATFIPLRHSDLRSRLTSELELNDTEQQQFGHLCRRLQAIFHIEHLSALLQLEELYCALDPDSQFADLELKDDQHRDRMAQSLFERVRELLVSAHYKRLSREELEQAIEVGCQWGVQLDVDFDLFETLELFARGFQTVEVSRRRWQTMFRKETIELPEFQRLIIAFRIKPRDESEGRKKKATHGLDHRFVYLKTFKNIPESDLEILLPGSIVRLTKFDRAKIILPTLSGAAITIFKIVRGALVLTLAFAWQQIFGWVILAGVTIGYIVKSMLTYFRTKNKYQFGLTKSLYLKNLDNNSSVIYRILNEAEEQELCEAILAYSFLWKNCARFPKGQTENQLDLLVEDFLTRATGDDVDFEVHDGLGKLARLGLAHQDPSGLWNAVPITDAAEALNKNWTTLFEQKAKSVVEGEPVIRDLFTD